MLQTRLNYRIMIYVVTQCNKLLTYVRMCTNYAQMHFTVTTTWKIRKFMGGLTNKVLLYIKLLEIFDNKIISKVSFFTKLNSINNLIG